MGGLPKSTTTRLDDGLRGWFKFFAGLVILINLGVCFVVPALWVDKEDSAERTINFTALAWLTMSGFGLIKLSELLGHDNKVLAKQRKLEEENDNYRLAAEEQRYQNYIDVAYQPIQPQQLQPQYTQPVQFVQQPPQQLSVEQDKPNFIDNEHTAPLSVEHLSKIDQTDYDIIKSNSRDKKSSVLMAVPGTGKTTLFKAYLWFLYDYFPESEVYITSVKNDSFMGLKEAGYVTVCRSAKDLLAVVKKIRKIVEERAALPEEERAKLHPVRWGGDDYYALVNLCSKDQKTRLKQDTGYIITVGRECNVASFFCTHELNVSDLGLTGKDIRSCLNINVLGFISTDEYGQSQGGYSALDSVLSREGVCSSEIQTELKSELNDWKEKSEESGKPILFSTIGLNPSLSLVPDLRWVSSRKLPVKSFESLQPSGKPVEGKPFSPIAKKIDLEKQPEPEKQPSLDLSPWAKSVLITLIKRSAQLGVKDFIVSDLISAEIISPNLIEWDDSIQAEQRTPAFALFMALNECQAKGHVTIDESVNPPVVRLF